MYQIDQSGKIEDTAHHTVIAYANGGQRAVLITAKTKRQIQERFRQAGLPRLFIPNTFAAGLFYLIEPLEQCSSIVIDTEYPGKEKLISTILSRLLQMYEKPKHIIRFARIGNRPRAHYAAKDVYDKKRKAERILSLAGIVKVLKKTDGRLRECL